MFLIKRIFSLNFKSMFEKIDLIHGKTKKSKTTIFLDMVKCALLYQAGYMDYYIFEMYDTPKENRKTYMTRGKNNKFIKELNDKSYGHIFNNKDEFNKVFKEFVKRDSINLSETSKEEAIKFIDSKQGILVGKPKAGACGKGIIKIIKEEYESTEKLYYYLQENNIEIIEEALIQHEEMNRMHPNSVNTIRTVSVNKNGRVKVICAYFRIGNGAFVDNFNSGGMVVPVDIETGEIKFDAIDKAGNIYNTHPITGTNIKGFKIPMWEIAKEMVKKAATYVPQVGLVGWDVCITKDGPALVEGNQFPGHDIYQLPCHTPDRIGMLPIFQKAIYGK